MKVFSGSSDLSDRGAAVSEGEVFKFRCHSGVTCFNKCCRNLNLFLYPHDVIMLREKLGISSSEFIDKYTDLVLRDGCYFPDVLLRMADNEEQTCPFLTGDGCSVYSNRPDSCRNFPVEHGVVYGSSGNIKESVHLFRPPEFCQGRFEDQDHTLASWKKDQEAQVTNEMTLIWSDIIKYFYSDVWGGEGPYGQKGKMVFMAAYNIDSFRDFVFNSSFLKRYKVKKNIQMQIKKNDISMLKFAYQWIGLFALGLKSDFIKIKK